PVEIYATGNVLLDSNSLLVTKTNNPRDMAIYITADDQNPKSKATIKWSSNSDYVGLIYAPKAMIDVNANFNVFGSIMARYVKLGANSGVHYDESLLFDDTNGPPVFERIAWKPVARQ